MGFFLFDAFKWFFNIFRSVPMEKEEYWDKQKLMQIQQDQNKLLKFERNKLIDNVRIFRDLHKIQKKVKSIIAALGGNAEFQDLSTKLSTLEQVLQKIKVAPNAHAEKETWPLLIEVWQGIMKILKNKGLLKTREIASAANDINHQLDNLKKIILGEQNFMLHKLYLLRQELKSTEQEIGEAA
ncbi:MAG: hypothetical protein V1735_07010 [Nanoarchaeota archaeon]